MRKILWASAMAFLPVTAAAQELETTYVSGARIAELSKNNALSITQLSKKELEKIGATHPEEITRFTPGAWVSRGDGQEHLTAIRSPVFTGAGACGAFVIAEDSIPVRAPGFCNANQLFDTQYENAGAIEVFRGPSASVFGGNALYGGINVLSPGFDSQDFVSLEVGDESFKRLNSLFGNAHHNFVLSLTDTDSFRENAGYAQQKIAYKNRGELSDWQYSLRISANNLEQETAGYIQGENSYENDALRSGNDNPEAYRDLHSIHANVKLSREFDFATFEIQPYMRRHEMQFLMHFVPWRPTEFNEHRSVGLKTALNWRLADDLQLVTGLDVEHTNAELKETQFAPAPFAQQNFPQGEHYSYQVDANMLSPFAELDFNASDKWQFGAQIRWQQQNYDYENQLSDGGACDAGASACRFFRPSSRGDEFSAFVWRLKGLFRPSDRFAIFSNVGTSFRAPQATELYRLQSEAEDSGLTEVKSQAWEIGLRGSVDQLDYQLAYYSMQQKDDIYQDNLRQYLTGADTSHKGLEYELRWRLIEKFTLQLSGSYAKHIYENSPETLGVMVDIQGNEIDTAPRRMTALRASWQITPNSNVFLSHHIMGDYQLDPANDYQYDGHAIWDAGFQQSLGKWQIALRIKNLTDERYAERADVAFGDYRYFPGAARSLFLKLSREFD